MDYEKAYKAVLQTAKQWIKNGCTDKERICLECVFPELRESEDSLEFLKGQAIEGVAEELYNDGESQCTVGVGTFFKPGEKVYVLKAMEGEE